MPGELPAKNSIYNIFIVSKSGGLIYHYDHSLPLSETEKTFSYPLDIKLEMEHKRIAVAFGERDGIRIGHSLLAVNGQPVAVLNGKAVLESEQGNKDVFQVNQFFLKSFNFEYYIYCKAGYRGQRKLSVKSQVWPTQDYNQ